MRISLVPLLLAGLVVVGCGHAAKAPVAELKPEFDTQAWRAAKGVEVTANESPRATMLDSLKDSLPPKTSIVAILDKLGAPDDVRTATTIGGKDVFLPPRTRLILLYTLYKGASGSAFDLRLFFNPEGQLTNVSEGSR